MRGHTFLDLAQRYELDFCPDSCGERGHRRGWIDRQGVIHWDPHRAMQRANLRRFLMLVYWAKHWRGEDLHGTAPELTAMRIHSASVFATLTARHDLGIYLPGGLAERDKARVRALLTKYPSDLRRQAVGRWAGFR